MTYKEIISILGGYKYAKRQYETAKRNLEEAEAAMTSVAIDYTKPRVMTSRIDDISGAIVRLIRLRRIYEKTMLEAAEHMEEVDTMIRSVPDPTQKDLLYKRYIQCKTWEQVAEELGYGRRHVYKLHGQAISFLSQR